MNTTFLWPTLAVLLVGVVWQTTYNVRRFTKGDGKRSDTSLLGRAAGCLFQWMLIVGLAMLGYRTAGIVGAAGALVALLVLPMAVTFVYLGATGRIRRRND